jgi:hypothetical protein
MAHRFSGALPLRAFATLLMVLIVVYSAVHCIVYTTTAAWQRALSSRVQQLVAEVSCLSPYSHLFMHFIVNETM